MNSIYKNKDSGRHCSKEGKEGQFCPGSGAFLNCYTPSNPLNAMDLSKLQIINIDNYKADVDKLKELLEKNPGRVEIIPADTLQDVEIVTKSNYNNARWLWVEVDECFSCSNCGYSALNDYRGNSADSLYCPNCGKRMINSSMEDENEISSN